jgi:hypothetical protein
MTMRPTDHDLELTLLALLAERGPGKSICPSEVPRKLLGEAGPWRSHLKRVRSLATRLAGSGRIVVLRHGRPATGEQIRGVVRLAQGPAFEASDKTPTPAKGN